MNDLDEIRKKISALDFQILELVAQRMELARRAGRIKLAQHEPITASGIEQQILAKNQQTGKKLNLPKKLVTDLTTLLIAYAKLVQLDE